MTDTTTVKVHPAFEYCRSREIATLNLTVHEFRHRMTGAVHYHLATPHDENVFMVAFRTVPMDSTGVAHVLEHTVLCGSERYPVRDPFFLMTRRSLNTFMNAFTTNDYTAYPFATQNRKDFFNLLDIYLDSVFFPRLDQLDFAQEGHRLEFEDPFNTASDLCYRGVVYNEMKGEAGSPVSVLYETLKSVLFPTTTYHYNSGGDPEHIPELSHEDLVAFYKSHYHPGNAVFMTFGNLPAHELQQVFEDKALHRFGRPGQTVEVLPERRYSEPVRTTVPYAVGNQTHIVMGWLLGPNTDLEMLLKCNLVADVLLDTSASPLRKVLEETDLGRSVSPLCGIEESNHEISFMCGLEGSEVHRADDVETLIMDVLEDVASNGVAFDRLEAVLHQLELHQREIGGDGMPYGLQLIFSCMAAAVHRGDPIELLDLDPIVEKLREEIRDPAFIRNLVRELLIDNPHRVRLVLYPDADLEQRKQERERSRLDAIKASMNEHQKEELVRRAQKLKERQERKENLDLLPKVSLDDVPADIRAQSPQVRNLSGDRRLTSYATGTNGIVYHQVVTRLGELPLSQLYHLPLYTQLAPEVGSAGRDYLETQHLQHSATGGINVFTAVRAAIDDVNSPSAFLTFSSRTLNRKANDMIRLLRDTSCDARFDELARIRDLVSQSRARSRAAVTNSGHVYAMAAAASALRPISWLNHQLTGLPGLLRLMALDDDLQNKDRLAEFADSLATLHYYVRASEKQFLVVSDPDFLDEVVSGTEAVWQQDPVHIPAKEFKILPGKSDRDQAWLLNTQVNYCAMAFPTVAETHSDSAALTVLAGVLGNSYLHGAIREKGGAYGAGAGHDTGSGVFRFFSYRDPNIVSTFDAFRRSIDWAAEGNAGFPEVEEAILGVIAGIDAPGSPAGEVRQTFHNGLFGRDVEHRRQMRRRILEVTPEDVRRVARIWLQTDGVQAVVASNECRNDLPDTFDITSIAE